MNKKGENVIDDNTYYSQHFIGELSSYEFMIRMCCSISNFEF